MSYSPRGEVSKVKIAEKNIMDRLLCTKLTEAIR
jgi:hypothetical protein